MRQLLHFFPELVEGLLRELYLFVALVPAFFEDDIEHAGFDAGACGIHELAAEHGLLPELPLRPSRVEITRFSSSISWILMRTGQTSVQPPQRLEA